MESIYFSAPEVAKKLNINVSTIKRWVDSGLLSADVTAGGHRRISTKNLSEFIRLQPRLASSSYIVKRLRYLKITGNINYRNYYSQLLRAETTFVRNGLGQYFLSGHPLISIVNKIVVPTLVAIGDEWSKGTISISDEHRMSFILRSELSLIESMIDIPTRKKQQKALLACVVDENHEIPSLILSLLLKEIGIVSIMLGINTPSVEVARSAVDHNVEIICLTKSYSNIDEVRYLNTIINHPLPPNIRIALGGAGWHIKPGVIAREIERYNSFSEFLMNIS